MKSVEDAYQTIANTLNAWAKSGWRSLELRTPIYRTMCGGMSFSSIGDNGSEEQLQFDWDGIDRINHAVLFLRDDLVRTTGQRIWGLTFTLRSNGKFSLGYDYNKPEGYEETDETIDVSLTDLAKKVNKGKLGP